MADSLPEAIRSILNNTFLDFELIIIDDGSTDHTGEVVEELKKETDVPIRYHKTPHRGKSTCVNEVFGNEKPQGKYIVFMDADDIIPRESLQLRYDTINASEADLVIGEFAIKDLQGEIQEIRRLDAAVTSKNLSNQFFYSLKTPVHLNAAIITKELLLKTGRFDERLIRGQEVDYAIRLLKAATKIEILTEVVYYYRKYYRPLRKRIKIRLQTMVCRLKTINKHTTGFQKRKAVMAHILFDSMKLVYELFRNYK